MVIISQDKTKILNFDNIEVVGIGNPLDNIDGKFQILVDTTNDNEFSIGEYKTEKRAKEVLNDLFVYKAMFEYFKCISKNVQDEISKDFVKDNVVFDTFEMPLE